LWNALLTGKRGVVDSIAEKDFTSLQPKFPAFSFSVPRFSHCPR
jgi:hypothetical protein